MVRRPVLINYICVVLGLFVLAIAVSKLPFRIDLTQDKRFSLKSDTHELLKGLDKPLKITVYLDGDMPPSFKRLQAATESILKDYQRFSDKPIQFSFIDPLKDLDLDKQKEVISKLAEVGIRPTQIHLKTNSGLTQKLIFPMALIDDGKTLIPVNLLSKSGGQANRFEENINTSIEHLEYSFSSRIQALMAQDFPRVGFTEGHGEPDNLKLYDAISSLGQRYQVGRVDLTAIEKSGLDSLKVLIVVSPEKEFSELEKYKLNYFIQKGGRVIWSLNQVDVSLADLEDGSQKLVKAQNLNLDDMLFAYGIRIQANLVSDINAAVIPVTSGAAGQNDIQLVPWVYFPIVNPDASHISVKKIDAIKTEFISSIDTLFTPGIKKHILFKSSDHSKVLATPLFLSLQLLGKPVVSEEFNSGSQHVGVLLEGKFKSVFNYRAVPTGISENYELGELSKDTKMFVIADGDVFINQVNAQDNRPFPLGFDRYAETSYGNKTLLLNMVDYMALDKPMLDLRNKEVKLRLLDKTKVLEDKFFWQMICLGLPLAMLITFAIYQHYSRMYRYAK